MKFRDPKTGEVFENIKDALEHYCPAKNERDVDACKRCAIGSSKNTDDTICTDFSVDHPAAAARLMGYEVIEDNVQKTFTETDLLAVLDKLADSCDTSNIDGTATGSNLFDFYWKCGNANAVNFIKNALGIGRPEKTVKEVNMEKKDKPRLAEVLGVEEDEEWFCTGIRVQGVYRIHDGVREHRAKDGRWIPCRVECDLWYLINHPESIIRAPRLTEAEMERCRVYGAKYLARDKTSNEVVMYQNKPDEVAEGSYGGGGYIGSVISNLFPSVHPGDCICVEEANMG